MIVQLRSIGAAQNRTSPMQIAAEDIATKLIEAEAAIDAALAAVASLTAAMPAATQSARVGMHVLQPALMHGMETCQQLVKARTNIVRTHKALAAARDDMGMETTGLMDICGGPTGHIQEPLRAVA